MTEVQEIVFPSSPEDRKKIKDAFDQISASKTRILGEKDYIKETIEKLSEDFNMPKAFLRKAANAYHNDSFDKVVAEAESLDAARILIRGDEE